jgi:hypothetical protein
MLTIKESREQQMSFPSEFLMLFECPDFRGECHSLHFMRLYSYRYLFPNSHITFDEFNQWIPIGVFVEVGQYSPNLVWRGVDDDFGFDFLFHDFNKVGMAQQRANIGIKRFSKDDDRKRITFQFKSSPSSTFPF